MKKILVSLATVGILAAPLIGLAQITMTEPFCDDIEHDLTQYKGCTAYGIGADVPEDDAQCCVIDKVLTVGDYIFVAILVVAILIILIAAWTFLTAGGNPDKVTSARNYLIYALVGIAVAFLARVLVRVVAAIMA